jgi:hypothetical protein
MKRSDIYKSLRDKLLADIAGITVDVNRGQVDTSNRDYPLPLPLALVNFQRIKWDSITENYEKGEMIVSVDYYKVIASGMFSGAEAEEETLELLDSPGEIWQSLRNYSVDGLFDELCRESEQEIKSGGMTIGYRMVFKTNLFEEFE